MKNVRLRVARVYIRVYVCIIVRSRRKSRRSLFFPKKHGEHEKSVGRIEPTVLSKTHGEEKRNKCSIHLYTGSKNFLLLFVPRPRRHSPSLSHFLFPLYTHFLKLRAQNYESVIITRRYSAFDSITHPIDEMTPIRVPLSPP